MSALGDIIEPIPVVSQLGSALGITSGGDEANAAQQRNFRDLQEAYSQYRPEMQQSMQQQQQNMATMMGPLNDLLMQNTGRQIDFGAAMAPVVSPEMMAIGSVQPPAAGAGGLPAFQAPPPTAGTQSGYVDPAAPVSVGSGFGPYQPPVGPIYVDVPMGAGPSANPAQQPVTLPSGFGDPLGVPGGM